MPRVAGLLGQAAVRDATCAAFKWFLESRFRILDEPLKARLGTSVLPTLGELPGVATDDLLEAFRSAIDSRAGTDTGCDELFKRFCDSLCRLADHVWWSEPLAVGPPGGYEWCGSGEGEAPPDWRSSDETLSISLVGQLPVGGKAEDDPLPSGQPRVIGKRMYMQVRAECSRSFFPVVCREAALAMSSLLRCVHELYEETFNECAREFIERKIENAEFPLARVRKALDISGLGPALTVNDEGQVEPAPGEEQPSYDSYDFIWDAIEAFFAEIPKKKDSFARRIKNAIRLIIESHNQSHNSIGLALSVTAMEALVCRKGDNLAQMFAENIAALLEPHPKYRLDAEVWSKRLYGLRSGVLHGSALECSAEDVRNSQVAAGIVLRALLERRAAIRRVGGNDENPEEFLQELRSGKYVPGQLTHVSELPLKRLWRKNAPKRVE